MSTTHLEVSITLGAKGAVLTEVIDTGIPTEEWDAMTPDNRQRCGDAEYEAWKNNQIGGDWRRA
ncbi:DUF7167 family protein [Sphaerisporangium album]|nr:hypothetical protein [Sphaerisporangium album]